MSIPLRPFLFGLACATVACGGRGHESAPAPTTGPATLKVENQAFADMTIYAVSSSVGRVRLGIATGHSTAIFTIPSYLTGGGTPVRFVADPIGSARVPPGDELPVEPGDTVAMTIPPQ